MIETSYNYILESLRFVGCGCFIVMKHFGIKFPLSTFNMGLERLKFKSIGSIHVPVGTKTSQYTHGGSDFIFEE